MKAINLRRAVLLDDGRVLLSKPRSHHFNPAEAVAREIRDATDPSKAPGKVRTLADMTPAEREEMLLKYGNGPAPKR